MENRLIAKQTFCRVVAESARMFDYEMHFSRFREDYLPELSLSFDMPEGYETAYGTFDDATETVFINAEILNDAPDFEKAYYLFHELRHALQYLRPELFGSAVVRSSRYVIMYDGTCFKKAGGGYLECRLEGGEELFANVYAGQPHETDANTYAYEQTKKLFGDSEELRRLYRFWMPDPPVPEDRYEKIYALIDEKTQTDG